MGVCAVLKNEQDLVYGDGLCADCLVCSPILGALVEIKTLMPCLYFPEFQEMSVCNSSVGNPAPGTF